VIRAIPSRYTSLATTRVLNAIEARIAHLAAASNPSTSAVGSASAYPRRCASVSAASNVHPRSDICVKT
jgi:hypothetical protein